MLQDANGNKQSTELFKLKTLYITNEEKGTPSIKPLHSTGSFLYSLKHQKNRGILMILVVVVRDQRHDTG